MYDLASGFAGEFVVIVVVVHASVDHGGDDPVAGDRGRHGSGCRLRQADLTDRTGRSRGREDEPEEQHGVGSKRLGSAKQKARTREGRRAFGVRRRVLREIVLRWMALSSKG